jgi:hypothetical protein
VPRLFAALTCWALLWCAGCGGPSPAATDPPVTSPETSSARPASPPEGPETPKPDPRPEVTFIRAWLDLLEYLNSTGDPVPLLQASTRCAQCRTIADDIAAIYRAGGWIKTGGYSVTKPRIVDTQGTEVTVRFLLSSGDARRKDRKGAAVRWTKAAAQPMEAPVGLVRGELTMIAFSRVSTATPSQVG